MCRKLRRISLCIVYTERTEHIKYIVMDHIVEPMCEYRFIQWCVKLFTAVETLHKVLTWTRYPAWNLNEGYKLLLQVLIITQASLCRNQALVCANFRRSMRMATYGYSLDSAFCSSSELGAARKIFVALAMRKPSLPSIY